MDFPQALRDSRNRRHLSQLELAVRSGTTQRHISFIENGRSVLTVARYVEANALSAQIVARAEHYDWSSASPKATADDRPTLSDWPVPKPPNWSTLVNLRTPGDELQRIRLSAARGIPYGSVTWTNQVIKDFKLDRRQGKFTWTNIGEGDIDWPEVRRALSEIKYDGYVTTEISGGDAAYLKDVSARVDRFLAGEKPVAS